MASCASYQGSFYLNFKENALEKTFVDISLELNFCTYLNIILLFSGWSPWNSIILCQFVKWLIFLATALHNNAPDINKAVSISHQLAGGFLLFFRYHLHPWAKLKFTKSKLFTTIFIGARQSCRSAECLRGSVSPCPQPTALKYLAFHSVSVH